jgi:hypothetical protein
VVVLVGRGSFLRGKRRRGRRSFMTLKRNQR